MNSTTAVAEHADGGNCRHQAVRSGRGTQPAEESGGEDDHQGGTDDGEDVEGQDLRHLVVELGEQVVRGVGRLLVVVGGHQRRADDRADAGDAGDEAGQCPAGGGGRGSRGRRRGGEVRSDRVVGDGVGGHRSAFWIGIAMTRRCRSRCPCSQGQQGRPSGTRRRPPAVTRSDAGGDADAVVRRAADGEAGHRGDGGADPGDPVEVADGVLRQATAPPLHDGVDGRRGQPGRRREVGERRADQVVVGDLEGLLLAVPAQRRAEDQQVPVGPSAPAARTQSHLAKEKVAAFTACPSTGGTRKPDAPMSTAAAPPGRRGRRRSRRPTRRSRSPDSSAAAAGARSASSRAVGARRRREHDAVRGLALRRRSVTTAKPAGVRRSSRTIASVRTSTRPLAGQLAGSIASGSCHIPPGDPGEHRRSRRRRAIGCVDLPPG